MLTLTRVEFEDALENGWIIDAGPADDLPYWLKPIAGISIAHLESRRSSSKKSYDQIVNARLAAIWGLVERMEEVLASDDPVAIINKHARDCEPKQHPARIKLWFYTYITFGYNKWALMPVSFRSGKWDRENHSSLQKLGRPHNKGKGYGYNCDANMKAKILKGLVKYKSSSKTMCEIYSDVLTGEFACISVKSGENIEYVHPNGEPFPSLKQFKDWTKKLISPKALKNVLKGQHKARSLSGSMGSFSEKILNVNQRVEFDGYYPSEKLSGVIEGSAVDGFCVVRGLCGLSGMVLGIGFSEGKESMDAYRMALFCMAIGKVKYCSLFGVDISPEDWTSEGLSGGIIFDRGPGAGLTDPDSSWLKAFELTPRYSGQSKATAESSHPRDKKLWGPPSHFHSELNFVEMAKREIWRVIEDNKTSDADGRMIDEMYEAGIKPTPDGIYRYWDSRGRNSAIGMEFDTAVRKFLRVCPASIKRDAVYLYGRKFRSRELEETGIFDRVAMNGVIKTEVFVLTMCVRYIWIEVSGVLYELDFLRPVSAAESSAYISLPDLKELDQMRRAAAGARRNEKPASQQFYRDRFTRDSEKKWDAGDRKLGSPTKGGAVQRDTTDFDRFRGKAK
ncbi:hypothetical protein AN403_4753 [Pseudomonas fluorescens]|uniref:Uncharacterized protein n=2 Tax=Pseudomonas fluorescens TaxID=294 RepID=A0A0P8XJF9_PSEFL|nr:hypothetical protein AN403_4753 [Pseudomonas fluorescens]